MKRLSLFKNLALLSSASLCVAPIIASSTGCSCAIKSFGVDVLSYTNYRNVQTENDVKHEKAKFDKILCGSKDLHDGNYVFIFGSVIENSLDTFMGGGRSRADYYAKETLETSVMYKVINDHMQEKTEEAPKGYKDFGIYSFIDYFDRKFYDSKGHEILIASKSNPKMSIQNVKPFDTWGGSVTDIQATKTLNKLGDSTHPSYEWDSESVKTTDYIRNDDYAVAYRKFADRAVKLYPKTAKRQNTFTNAANSDNCKIAIFQNGILSSIEAIPSADDAAIKTFAEKLIKLYKIS